MISYSNAANRVFSNILNTIDVDDVDKIKELVTTYPSIIRELSLNHIENEAIICAINDIYITLQNPAQGMLFDKYQLDNMNPDFITKYEIVFISYISHYPNKFHGLKLDITFNPTYNCYRILVNSEVDKYAVANWMIKLVSSPNEYIERLIRDHYSLILNKSLTVRLDCATYNSLVYEALMYEPHIIFQMDILSDAMYQYVQINGDYSIFKCIPQDKIDVMFIIKNIKTLKSDNICKILSDDQNFKLFHNIHTAPVSNSVRNTFIRHNFIEFINYLHKNNITNNSLLIDVLAQYAILVQVTDTDVITDELVLELCDRMAMPTLNGIYTKLAHDRKNCKISDYSYNRMSALLFIYWTHCVKLSLNEMKASLLPYDTICKLISETLTDDDFKKL